MDLSPLVFPVHRFVRPITVFDTEMRLDSSLRRCSIVFRNTHFPVENRVCSGRPDRLPRLRARVWNSARYTDCES